MSIQHISKALHSSRVEGAVMSMWMEPGSLIVASCLLSHISAFLSCANLSLCSLLQHIMGSVETFSGRRTPVIFHSTSPTSSQPLAALFFSPARKECWPPLLQRAQWGSASLPAALILIQVMWASRTSQEDILQTSNCYCLSGTLKKVSRAPRLPGGHFQTPNLLWLQGRWHVW